MSAPHGKCLVSVDDDIIYIKPIGAFNKEGIVKATQDIRLAIQRFGQSRFKLLIDYSEIGGATPEAFDKINEFNQWLNTQNMAAKAIVNNLLITIPLLEKMAPARNLQNDKHFENNFTAKEWLNRQS